MFTAGEAEKERQIMGAVPFNLLATGLLNEILGLALRS
jgi:hypothetical protein